MTEKEKQTKAGLNNALKAHYDNDWAGTFWAISKAITLLEEPAEKPFEPERNEEFKRKEGKHKLVYDKKLRTIVGYCKTHKVYYQPSGNCYKCCPEPAEKPESESNTDFIDGARALLRQGADDRQWAFATLLRKACDRLEELKDREEQILAKASAATKRAEQAEAKLEGLLKENSELRKRQRQPDPYS
ncbi:MAG: hypothetical protein MUO31_06680 [Thermodesulfovibrionales bacterium]|nr:hypothetical protein [Thermodesulfovibrionales bacterium]